VLIYPLHTLNQQQALYYQSQLATIDNTIECMKIDPDLSTGTAPHLSSSPPPHASLSGNEGSCEVGPQ